jgi:hypothetical protein
MTAAVSVATKLGMSGFMSTYIYLISILERVQHIANEDRGGIVHKA